MTNQPYYLSYPDYRKLLASYGLGPVPTQPGYDEDGNWDYDLYSRERQLMSAVAASRGYEQPFLQQRARRDESWQPLPRNPTRDKLTYGLMDRLEKRGIR